MSLAEQVAAVEAKVAALETEVAELKAQASRDALAIATLTRDLAITRETNAELAAARNAIQAEFDAHMATHQPTPTPTPTPAPTSVAPYLSTLVNGKTPYYPFVALDLKNWKVGAGSSWNIGLDHSVRLSAGKQRVRVEIQNTEKDKADGDPTGCRRSEIKGSVNKLPNGVPLWGAFSFNHHPWADPAGMATKAGGVHGQIHIGSTFGGSPAVAFRRRENGNLRITTRGEFNTSNTTRYDKPLSFGEVHDLVYRVVLDPKAGELTVWLDGVKIVDIRGQSIGASTAECHLQLGAYYAGGITCPVVAEYGNHVYPGPADLSARISNRPAWPND